MVLFYFVSIRGHWLFPAGDAAVSSDRSDRSDKSDRSHTRIYCLLFQHLLKEFGFVGGDEVGAVVDAPLQVVGGVNGPNVHFHA